MKSLVLGTGIVGAAAAWDLARRGHEVTVCDIDRESVERVAGETSATPIVADVTDSGVLGGLLGSVDVVVSAIPYRFGVEVATAALEAGTNYLDFGGNPTVVARQKELDSAARAAGLMIVPDCGLAPGLANVLGEDLIESARPGRIDSIQMRVGALPQVPTGALGYQLAFNAAGLINEYAEPCEVIDGGRYSTVEPLTRFETVEWDTWGPLEAFSTAGGTSTMCTNHTGRVSDLEYKTLRFPGHGRTFRALYEIGMFDEPRRRTLIDALNENLPHGAPDLVLVRAWRVQGGEIAGYQIEDTSRDGYSALARTTAFPATALAHLIGTGQLMRPGVASMNEAVSASELLPELRSVDIEVEAF